MAGSPNVLQGTLNRLKASIVIPLFPSLNITPPFLGKEAIGIAFKGPATIRIPTMTSGVNSPEPYREVEITAHLVRSQGLAQAWKAQEELNTILGQITVRPDVAGFPPYQFMNCSLDGISSLTINGMDAGYVITMGGFYNVNSALWS